MTKQYGERGKTAWKEREPDGIVACTASYVPRYLFWYAGVPVPSQKYLARPQHRQNSLTNNVNLYELVLQLLR